MKYKAGDSVIIIGGALNGYSAKIIDTASKYYSNDIVVVTCKIDGKRPNNFAINENKLRPAHEEERKADMTKQDLKEGMILECKNGNRRLLIKINNEFIGVSNIDSYLTVYNFNDDLSLPANTECSIVKVYLPIKITGLKSLLEDTDNLSLIWERKKQVKEMTISEIEKELGYSVKII